jgi:hypothetical protein
VTLHFATISTSVVSKLLSYSAPAVLICAGKRVENLSVFAVAGFIKIFPVEVEPDSDEKNLTVFDRSLIQMGQ